MEECYQLSLLKRQQQSRGAKERRYVHLKDF
jgi:hypothetical protein